MLPKNIPLYKLDLTGKNPDNKISQEYYRRADLEHDIAFVMRSGPFYTDSLVLTKPTGEVLVEDVDYELLGIAADLTAFVKDKEVGMLILIKNQTIAEWFAEYQVVGHFSILNQDLVNMVNGAVNDDRPVLYKNINGKPLWFKPELHQHDLRYEIHSFTDLINCIKRIKDVKGVLPDRNLTAMDQFHSVILSRIEAYEKMLLSYIRQHDSEYTSPYTNDHGLTAAQVEMEKVDNFKTATLLDILDGFRKDLHVTADLLKRAVDTIGKETENLVRLGTLPVLRYGSNSFIPSPIKGSFEGMGGNDFNFGSNIESNGDGLILMNRNDGRVNGLYFMENKSKNIPSDKWGFTGYRYTHQTATAEGVDITRIIRGSNGKFLIVGGNDKNGKLIWYYSLGNGTLNPEKHTLQRLPDEIQNLMGTDAVLCSAAFPSRILLCKVIDQNVAWKDPELRKIGFSTPTEDATIDGFNIGDGTFSGQYMWEYEIASKTWRKVIFSYNQAYGGPAVKHQAWIPYRYIIEEVTADNPRADGANHKYGLKQAEYIFSKLISYWYFRRRVDVNLDKYDESSDRIAIKYISVPYGGDDRNGLIESPYSSIGIILKNRVVSGSEVYYDVENRKGLVNPTYADTTKTFISFQTTLTGEKDHSEWVVRGIGSYCWGSDGKILAGGTMSYGTFPMDIKTADLNGLGSWESFSNFVDGSFSSNLAGSSIQISEFSYNEKNPANLTIGAHSTFWLQLNSNDPTSYGSVSLSSPDETNASGLLFRKQPALDVNGYPKIPSKVFDLYKDSGANGKTSYGYELNNGTYQIENNMGDVFCTNIFVNAGDNRKAEYIKNRIAHHSFPGEMTQGNKYTKPSTANFIFNAEWDVQVNSGKYKIVPTKRYNLESQIKDVLLPKIKDAVKDNGNLNFNHSLGSYRIAYTNLRGNKYEKLLVLLIPALDTVTEILYIHTLAFNLTGGSADGSGIIQGATVTPVGNVVTVQSAKIREDQVIDYCKEDPQVVRYVFASYTQPRDLVMQLNTGASLLVLQLPTSYLVKGNRHEAGVALLVDETGITKSVEKSVYYTAGQYRFFHHPYYGLVSRRFGTGPSELGFPIKDPAGFNLDYDTSRMILGNSNYLESVFSIYFSSAQKVILNGRRYDIGSSIFDLYTITPDPRNKTFYIYLDYDGSGAYYNVSPVPLAETSSRGMISIVRTNNDSIYEIENYNVFTMNSIRISTVKHGSVIPAATGTIEQIGQTEGWVTNNRS